MNREGYNDPTAEIAVARVMKQENRRKKLNGEKDTRAVYRRVRAYKRDRGEAKTPPGTPDDLKVSGSMHEFPYALTTFKVEGSPDEEIDLIYQEERLLYLQKADAYELKIKVEEWLSTVPIRIRRIVHLKYFEGLSWEEVGDRVSTGGGESVRKEFNRYLKENP